MFVQCAARCVAACSLMFIPSAGLAQIDGIGGEKLEVQLKVPEGKTAAFKGAEPIAIDFVLRNPTDKPVQVLVWRTPFKGVTENIFEVASGRTSPAAAGGGGQIGYIGPIIKRGPPTADDYVTLAPGQAMTASVDLGQYYAIYQQSDYSVAYRPAPVPTLPISTPPPSPTTASGGQLKKMVATSNALTFSVTEARAPAPKAALKASPAATAGATPTTFDECTAEQQNQLNTAVPKALEIAAAAAAILKNTPPGQQPNSARYKTWFGVHSAARYATVSGHYEKIEASYRTKQIEIACKGSQCRSNIYAYVFPTQPYKIYVCGAFWSAGLEGTDSRSGTLVHEMSHFDIVAGTDDVVYGQTGAKDLAKSNPDTATTNADTHEYFAENTPNEPM